jgi:uncharacterized protein DUF5916/cellulose/xylan binding protein with CBM9 domain
VASVGSAQSPTNGELLIRGTPASAISRAVRVARPPVLDGRDDDAAWRDAAPFEDFVQFDPAEAVPPSLPTQFRVVYDDRDLYVFVRAHDPHPDSIVGRLSRRDVNTNSDKIGLVIDAYHDRRTGVQLMVNPVGVRSDNVVFLDNQTDPAWDGVWEAATRVDSLGWTAEFRIPFSQLRFNDQREHVFGFAVWREIARRSEKDAWPPTYRSSRQGMVSQIGTLEGLNGIRRSSKLELLPFVTTQSNTEQGPAGWGHTQRSAMGLDFKYGIKENLTLDATINPDFGQVEVDPAVLNLTAFEVRFEERRPFFQEGVGMFRCTPCQGIFYPRRIGRTPQLRSDPGDPLFTTIAGAAKLTGRFAGGFNLGVIDAVTQREVGVTGKTVEPQTNYFVGRASRDFRGGSSSIGLITTAVNRSLDDDSRDFLRRGAYLAVVDGVHRFADDNYEIGGYTGRVMVEGSEKAIARTQLSSIHYHQRPDGDVAFDSTKTSMSGGVVAFNIGKIGGALRYNTFVRLASPEMELNDAGLVPLINDKSIRNNINYRSLRPGSWYRSSFSMIETENHWTSGGMPSGSLVRLHTSYSMLNNWGWALTYNLSNPNTNYCTSCARGGPALRLDPSQFFQVNVNGDNRRSVIPQLQWAVSAGDGGRSWERSGSVGADLRISSRFSTSLNVGASKRADNQQWIANYGHFLSDTTHYTFARLAQTTVSMTARASFTATPLLTFQFYAQPFMSAGSFSDWRELDAPRADGYVDRFQSYGNGAVPNGFNFKQFNSNAVVRWEYRPGSTLFLVWQQGRAQDELNRGSFEFERDYRDLFRAHPVNTFLVKATYFFNP